MPILVTIRVRPGGALSPVLINLYIDDLSNKHETSMMLDGWLLMILGARFFFSHGD